MPSAVAPNPHAASHDHDDHEYDDAIEELFRDLPIENGVANNARLQPAEPTRDIDQEIKVRKQRKPNPKLDEERLLSHNGLPRLRKITKSRLRFKGKGHEFSDVSKLLNMYQLWLDDLYPRAKFRDALTMVEKVGHSKRMKVMRKAWLDDTKPFRKDADADEHSDANERQSLTMSGALSSGGDGERADGAHMNNDDVIFVDDQPPRPLVQSGDDRMNSNDGPDEDELDALLAEHDSTKSTTQSQTKASARGPFEEDSDEDDELDALLAAEPPINNFHSRENATFKTKSTEGDFADEEEIMADMDMW